MRSLPRKRLSRCAPSGFRFRDARSVFATTFGDNTIRTKLIPFVAHFARGHSSSSFRGWRSAAGVTGFLGLIFVPFICSLQLLLTDAGCSTRHRLNTVRRWLSGINQPTISGMALTSSIEIEFSTIAMLLHPLYLLWGNCSRQFLLKQRNPLTTYRVHEGHSSYRSWDMLLDVFHSSQLYLVDM